MPVYFSLLPTFLLSWILVKISIEPFTKLLPDVPNERSSHSKIVPRGGGLAFVISFYLSSYFLHNYTFLYFLPLAFIGFLDDFWKVSRKIRFLIQILTVYFIYISSNIFQYFSHYSNIYLLIAISLVFIILGTAIINFTNFMDGIDGIVAGCMFFIFICIAIIIDSFILTLSASLLGFIFWNWSPAKIFMGDVGSTFLGAFFTWSLFNTSSTNEFLGLFLLFTPFFLDSITCLARRYISGQPVFNAHSMHLYQRLVKGGLSHKKVSTIYISSTILLSIALLTGGLKYELIAASVTLIIGIWLNSNYAKSFRKSL